MSHRPVLLAVLAPGLAALLAACSGAESPSPSPAVPSWTDITNACEKGTPIAVAAEYTGSTHPIAVANLHDATDWTPGWFVEAGPLEPAASTAARATWNALTAGGSPIQLVVCRSVTMQPAHSCGSYVRSDGVSGEVILLQEVDRIEIVIAQTGKTLESKSFTGALPDPSAQGGCPTDYSVAPQGTPPWEWTTSTMDFQPQIDYVLSVITRPAG